MGLIIPMAIIVSALVIVIITILLGVLVISTGRITETNRQLMILAAGKEAKPETLRALVASAKPPQGKLKGIAEKKKDDKTKNTNYTMEIGVINEL